MVWKEAYDDLLTNFTATIIFSCVTHFYVQNFIEHITRVITRRYVFKSFNFRPHSPVSDVDKGCAVNDHGGS